MKKNVCRKICCKSSSLGKACVEWIIIKSWHGEMLVSSSRNGVCTRMTVRLVWVSLLVPWFESDSLIFLDTLRKFHKFPSYLSPLLDAYWTLNYSFSLLEKYCRVFWVVMYQFKKKQPTCPTLSHIHGGQWDSSRSLLETSGNVLPSKYTYCPFFFFLSKNWMEMCKLGSFFEIMRKSGELNYRLWTDRKKDSRSLKYWCFKAPVSSLYHFS